MYSTPNASRAFAMAILVLVSKKALANCSPSVHVDWDGEKARSQDRYQCSGSILILYLPLRVLSIMLKFETLLKKSDALGA